MIMADELATAWAEFLTISDNRHHIFVGTRSWSQEGEREEWAEEQAEQL